MAKRPGSACSHLSRFVKRVTRSSCQGVELWGLLPDLVYKKKCDKAKIRHRRRSVAVCENLHLDEVPQNNGVHPSQFQSVTRQVGIETDNCGSFTRSCAERPSPVMVENEPVRRSAVAVENFRTPYENASHAEEASNLFIPLVSYEECAKALFKPFSFYVHLIEEIEKRIHLSGLSQREIAVQGLFVGQVAKDIFDYLLSIQIPSFKIQPLISQLGMKFTSENLMHIGRWSLSEHFSSLVIYFGYPRTTFTKTLMLQLYAMLKKSKTMTIKPIEELLQRVIPENDNVSLNSSSGFIGFNDDHEATASTKIIQQFDTDTFRINSVQDSEGNVFKAENEII